MLKTLLFLKKTEMDISFSKSIKGLPEKEKIWVLLDNDDWQEVRSNNGTLLYKYKSCIDKFPYTIEVDGKKKTVSFNEKRLLTYNPKLASKKKYEINKQNREKQKLYVILRAKRTGIWRLRQICPIRR